MTSISRDDLSLSQGTTWGATSKDILSIMFRMMEPDDISEAENMRVIRERTRQARQSRNLNTKQIAKLLGIGEARYKKWEEREDSVIPTRFVRNFCAVTLVDSNWLTNTDVPKKVTKRAG